MNSGHLEMIINVHGQAVYNVILLLNDIVDTLYGINGSALTTEEYIEYKQSLISHGQVSSTTLQRKIETRNIDKASIKTFLLDRTGDAQIEALKRLDLLYSSGNVQPRTTFKF